MVEEHRGPLESPNPLDHLVEALDDAVARLEAFDGVERDWILGWLHAGQRALRASRARLGTRAAAGTVPASAVLGEWHHAVRGTVHAIVGWVRILSITSEKRARTRAAESIERNVRQLIELLARLPADR